MLLRTTARSIADNVGLKMLLELKKRRLKANVLPLENSNLLTRQMRRLVVFTTSSRRCVDTAPVAAFHYKTGV